MLIGVCGKVGEGKTTIAKHLRDAYGFKIMSFGGPLKKIVSVLFNIPLETLNHPIEKDKFDPRWGKTPRTIMQLFGTDCMRNFFGYDFWVQKMEHQLLLLPQHDIVIDDVRFPDEADMVTRKNGILIQVVRSNNPLALQSAEALHASERIDRLNPTKTFDNDSQIIDLHVKIDWFMHLLPEVIK